MVSHDKNTTTSLQTIRIQFYLAVIVFLFITSLLIMLLYWFGLKENRVERAFESLTSLNLNFKEISKLEKDFLSYETENINFFQTRESVFLIERQELINNAQILLSELRHTEEFHTIGIIEKVKSINREIKIFNHKFDTLVQLIKKRGFDQHGLEGEMQAEIRIVEAYPHISKEKIHQIRKLEKNFLLRKQMRYAQELKHAVMLLRIQLNNSSYPHKQRVIKALDKYLTLFLTISEIEKTIGIHNRSGLKGELHYLTNQIEQHIQEMNTKVFIAAEDIGHRIKIILIGVMIVGITINSVIIYIFFLRLGIPILKLAHSIDDSLRSGFDPNIKIDQVKTNREIGIISDYITLTRCKLIEYRDKLHHKNQEYEKQRILLDEQKQKIQLYNQNLRQLKSELTKQESKLIEVQNKLDDL